MKKSLLPTLIVTPRVPELATKAHEGTPQYGDYGHPSTLAPPSAPPDRRAEGGNVFNLLNEQTTL